MTDKVAQRLEFLKSGKHKLLRIDGALDLSKYGSEKEPPPAVREAYFKDRIALEKPILTEGDIFGFNQYFNPTGTVNLFEYDGNVTPDYEGFLAGGLSDMLRRIELSLATADATGREFLTSVKSMLIAAEEYAGLYRDAAISVGNGLLADALSSVPHNGARNYYEALVMIKFLHYILRLNRSSHLTLGRFDKYMKPYFDRSLAEGATEDELLEMTELFFISMNFDTDTYVGAQMGDNGQSLVLGGLDADGNDVWSSLSEICLTASEELRLIDPKINVRVSSETPIEFYERCTRLTRLGLGFPQYSNDDVVIPGLIGLGYDVADAMDYSVAACWEFIIPRYGGDVPNRSDLDFPSVVSTAVKKHLREAKSFDGLCSFVDAEIKNTCDRIVEEFRTGYPAGGDVLMSAFILPCIERGRTFYNGGAKYSNDGAHGAGLSSAADAMTAIELGVFGGEIDKEELLTALDKDFEGYEHLRQKLLSYPKMGNDDERADKNAVFLLDAYSKHLSGRSNGRFGIWRAGTGSALNYVILSSKLGATADGRLAFTPYEANLSPSLNAKISSPTAVVRSFTKYDYKKAINGGPLTIEIHNRTFNSSDGIKNVAALVKSFIDLGGHQIQINCIDRSVLLDAERDPESHKSLIVRVWGWSGYFVELDKPYRDHVIKRTEYTL